MWDETVSCMADSWVGVNNWSSESVGMAGGLRRSSTEDLKVLNFFVGGQLFNSGWFWNTRFSSEATMFACVSALNSLAA